MTLAILKDLEKQLTDYEELILTAPKRQIIRRQKYAAAKRLDRKDYTVEEIAETLNIKIEEVEEYLYRRYLTVDEKL